MRFAVIDFEASSLNIPNSYPISVGVIKQDESVYHAYIKPSVEDWTDWDIQSEGIHKIPRNLLWDIGQDPTEVAIALNNFLGDGAVVCDGHRYDMHWCDRLYQAAGIQRSWQIMHVTDALAQVGISDYLHGHFYANKGAIHAGTGQFVEHDALDDAKVIQLSLQHVYEEFINDQQR